MAKNPLAGREIIIEFYPVGHIVRVSAMDTKTLTEVSIQAPASTTETVMRQTIRKKLEYVLTKKGLI